MDSDNDSLPIDSRTRAIIDGLPPDERASLEELMTHAAAQQRNRLETALDDAVRLVPAPLRKRLQKLFIG